MIVYTAISGPGFTVRRPSWIRDDVQYMCVTDQPAHTIPPPWRVMPLERTSRDDVRNAKRYKILPHLLIPELALPTSAAAPISIWVDASFEITRGFDELLPSLDDHLLTVFRHPVRQCLYEEARLCRELKLDDARRIDDQMAAYRAAGFPSDYGLAEGGTLLRRHTRELNRLMEFWWNEVERGSRRDQLSLMYAIWKLDMRDRVLILDRTSRDGHFHAFRPPVRQRGLAETTMSMLPNTARVRSLGRRAARFVRRAALNRQSLEALERRAPQDAVVFMYHVVADHPLPYLKHLGTYKTPAEFDADVAYLKRRYELPTWPEFLRLRGRRGPGRPPALLTFDDGLAQCFDQVRPILLKHGVPCVFFIVKDFVDNRRMHYRHKVSLSVERLITASSSEQAALLTRIGRDAGIGAFSLAGFKTWIKGLEIVNEPSIDRVCELLDIEVVAELERWTPYMTSVQVQRLASEGFTIGGHSTCHPHLQLLGEDACEEEIASSCDFARTLSGGEETPFAFPFHGRGLDRRMLGGIIERHPSIGVMFDVDGFTPDAPFVLHRIGADQPTGLGNGQSGLEAVTRATYIEHLCR